MVIRTVANIKNRLMNASIKSKMIIVNCIIIFLVAFSIGATAYTLYQQTITSRLATVNQRDLRQIANSMEYIQKDIEELSSFIGSDSVVQKVIRSSAEDLNTSSKDQTYVRYMLNNLLVSKDYLSFISLHADNGFSYYAASDKSSNIPPFSKVKTTPYYDEAFIAKGAPIWAYLPRENNQYILNNRSNKLSMFRTVLRLTDYTPMAFMMISINTQGLKEIYKNLLDIHDSTILFLDEKNEVFLYDTNVHGAISIEGMVRHIPSSSKQLQEGYEIYDSNGEKYLLNYVELKNSKWKILNVVPLKSFAINIRYIPIFVIIIFVLALVIGFYLTTFTASLLTKPIKKLVASMNRVKKGDFQETVQIKYNDEIGELCADYNAMIAHINKLLNQVYALEIEERIAELKALEAQINPHFLYNTLDNIYWKAVAGDNKGVQEMVHALSKVFRLALNVGKEFSSISQEKEFIGYYIQLQEKRYRNKLQYSIDFSAEIMDHQIPKLILQPFVENAIVHGIETGDKKTTVSISGFMDDGRIHFIIKDDGTGMSQDVLDKLKDPQTDENATAARGGYGIKNVINRLLIYYGTDHVLTIQSELGSGTEINIILPTSPRLTSEKGRIKSYV